ncbi:hypothetical protein [Pseudomonas sp. UBA6562]|uniref:hypothetical protein n=1 Tax=Pseudomonas sp. UBA6562 TaxID=1947332 RepID=UPI0025D78A16|nr:hypothetical protein [Pseudomonas sp. UBA6562]
MILEYLNATAAGGIAFWASWAVLSAKVRDGVFGKLLYAAIALSGYALLAGGDHLFFNPSTAAVTLHVALALAGIRHMLVLTYWLRCKRWLMRQAFKRID